MPRTCADWIDISLPLRSGMATWPGDPAVQIERVLDMAAGEPCNVTGMTCAAHAGTHVDAPLHVIEGGVSVDQIPLEALIGPARVIDIADPVSIKPQELDRHAIQAGQRILFRTLNSAQGRCHGEFQGDYVHLTPDSAEFLAAIGPRCIGIDYLSVGGAGEDGLRTHISLLKAGVWLIEDLDLALATPGDWELVCLPLRIVGADGAPARAILRKLPSTEEQF